MAGQAKPRKRIVPEQILSPTKSQAESGGLTTAVGPKVVLGDLKEHSVLAAELLGAGRKIHVNLARYQAEKKAVDWKEVRWPWLPQPFRSLPPGPCRPLTSRTGLFHPTPPQLLKERGVKREKRVMGPQTGDGPGGLLAPSRAAATNPLALVMQKLERAVGMVR